MLHQSGIIHNFSATSARILRDLSLLRYTKVEAIVVLCKSVF